MHKNLKFVLIVFGLISTFKINAQDTILKKEYIRKGDLVYFKDTLYTGIAIKKADNGKTIAIEKYKKGLATGLWKEWYNTGKIKFEGAFIKGVNDGTWTEWNADGSILRRIHFKGGNIVEVKQPEIMEKVANIDQNNSYDSLVLENDEFMEQASDGGGSLTGFFKDGHIHKMTMWIGISMGIRIYNYYFEDEKLIYIDETFESFDWTDTTNKQDYPKTEITFHGCYYFSNNKLIDYETTGQNWFQDDAIDIEMTLLEEANGNLKLLLRKKK